MATLGNFAGRDTLSSYTREDLQTYNELFNPELLALREIGLGMGAGNAREAATRGIDTAGRVFDSTMGSFARDQERAGLAVDPATAASQARRLSLSRIIQQVDAANRGSRNAVAARRTAQAFGMDTFGDATSTANQTLSYIAQREADRDAQYRDARARSRSAEIGTAASLVGVGLALI